MMRKFLFCFSLLLGNILTITFSPLLTANAEIVPPYAKWGKIAMEKTKEKYPNADIIDYLHIGRVNGLNSSVEKFRLWLKEKNKEFGVLIDIEFDKKTERLINIKFKEVTR